MKQFMFFLTLVFVIFIGNLNANSITIEDAEDGTTSGWSVYDNNPSNATISNVVDAEQGKVIALSGEGMHNGYMLGHWGSVGFHIGNKKLSWKMKYDEMFTVYIIVKTEDGNRYLWYTPKDSSMGLVWGGRYIHHGLGADAVNGEWHTFSRDLEVDLQKYSPELHVLEIKAFLVRGSGYIDDIQAIDSPIVQECNSDIDDTVLNKVLDVYDAFYDFNVTDAKIHKFNFVQGNTFFFAIYPRDEPDYTGKLFRVDCRDHSNIEELYHMEYANEIDYAGSIEDVAYFNNYHDSGSFGTPLYISEGEPLKRIPFIGKFLSENNLHVFGDGLRIVNGNLELATTNSRESKYQTYIFSPDGRLLGSPASL